MAKILLKTAVLLFIVFSIYFIVNPGACSNMMSGQGTASPAAGQSTNEQSPAAEQTETFSAGAGTGEEVVVEPSAEEGLIDTNTLTEEAAQPVYSQADIDYAIASRYVELEREYSRNQPLGKDASREISFIVMDDFEMSPTEWEGFLQRATASDLFNKVRQEMPPASEQAAQ